MRLKYLYTIILLVLFVFTGKAQDTYVSSQSAEIEASKQTEMLHKQLKLSDDQLIEVYDINLKFAQKRQESMKRSDAVEMIKSKNEAIEKVLNSSQVNTLRTVRQNNHTIGNEQEAQTSLRTIGVTNRTATRSLQESSNRVTNQTDLRQSTTNRPVRGEIRTQQNIRNSSVVRESTNTQTNRVTTRENQNSVSPRRNQQTTTLPVRTNQDRPVRDNAGRGR